MNCQMITTAMLVLALNSPAVAQSLPPDRSEVEVAQESCAVCFRGQPKDRCASFIISEAYLLMPLSESNSLNRDVGWIIGNEIGWMLNVSDRSAIGVTGFALVVPAHAGLKFRYRRWLTNRLALDADLGAVLIHDEPELRDWYVGSVGLNWKDRLHFSLQCETKSGPIWERVPYKWYSRSRQAGYMRTVEIYAGVRFGSEASLTVSTIEMIGLMFLAAAWE